MPRTTIRLRGVSHTYGRRHALRVVNIDLQCGVTGLLGPNGAGKSTLLKLLATALPLQSGQIEMGGLPLSRKTRQTIRRQIGYLPQRFSLMDAASVRKNVEFAAWAHGLEKCNVSTSVESVLARVALDDRADDRAGTLSGGMRQRLGLACVLVHDPSVMLLDEPTVGLDPEQRRGLRRVIDDVGRSSVVLVSTHLVEDLATAADRVIVMDAGRVLFDDTMPVFRGLSGDGDGAQDALERSYFSVLDGRADD